MPSGERMPDILGAELEKAVKDAVAGIDRVNLILNLLQLLFREVGHLTPVLLNIFLNGNHTNAKINTDYYNRKTKIKKYI